MTEGYPDVGSESQSLEIPLFPRDNSPRIFSLSHLDSGCLSQVAQTRQIRSLPDLTNNSVCQCPHVLVSDDDPFQNFYYETLFKNSIKWQEILGTNENFRFELFPTGETLLARFDKIKSCKCGRTVLVITDYNMGLKKLNGVQTVSALRKAGFAGSIILRTSEEKEDLYKAHPNLSEMLMSETISCFVEKNNLKKAKDAIQNLVKKMRD